MAFFELALTSGSIVSFITPDKWLSKPFGEKFRQNQMRQRLYKITKAGNKVFESATVDAIITLFIKNSRQTYTACFSDNKTIESITHEDISNIEKPFLIDYLFSDKIQLIKEIDIINTRIFDYAECENACATSDFYIVKDLIESNCNPPLSTYYKLINTGTISKYYDKWAEKDITYGGKFSYPVVSKKKFNEKLGKSYIKRASRSKLIFKGLNLLDGCIDEMAQILPGKSTIVICSEDIQLLKFLLGVLNSKLPLFYIKVKYSSSSYCGGITFSKDMINNLPIPIASKQQQQTIIDLVNKIITTKKANPQADTSNWEKEIDKQVYQLYGLNEDEIKIVENCN